MGSAVWRNKLNPETPWGGRVGWEITKWCGVVWSGWCDVCAVGSGGLKWCVVVCGGVEGWSGVERVVKLSFS